MTRDEYRSKCIAAIKQAAPGYMKVGMPDDLLDWHFTRIFDALHGIAMVMAITDGDVSSDLTNPS